MAKNNDTKGLPEISWNGLSHRARTLISIDCEPNFIRAMLDRMVLTLSEQQIEQVEIALRSSDPDITKAVLYDHFIDTLFDDVHDWSKED